ncbi:MAG: hypothetical protein ACKOAX_01085 [Candidatus Kapaibacterium sp.]
MRLQRDIWLIATTLAVAFVVMLSGCKESSLVPLDVRGKLDAFVGRSWMISEDNVDAGDTTLTPKGWVLDLRSDGSYSTSGPTTPSSSGRWEYNASDSTITLVSADGKARTTFILDSVGGASAVLKRTTSRETLVFKQRSAPLFSVSGPLAFEKNMPIPASRTVHVVWKMLGTSDRYLVWGTGTIDELNGSFRVEYDAYPPDSVVQRFYGCSGKVGIGHVVVFSDGVGRKDGAIVTGPLISRISAIVRNHALVFVFGRPADTPCVQRLPWTGWFQSGYNLGESLMTPNGTSFYRPVGDIPLTLTFSDEAATLQTPVWWQL